MKKLLLLSLVFSILYAKNQPTRVSKSDKENLIHLIAEPMKNIEQKIDTINQAANQIQNFIVENYNQSLDKELKEQYQKILQQISHLALLTEALAYVVQAQTQVTQDISNQVGDLELSVEALQIEVANIQNVIGSLTDLSVGEEEFNSVQDIDDAQLTLVSWLKSVYREQLYNKFIS